LPDALVVSYCELTATAVADRGEAKGGPQAALRIAVAANLTLRMSRHVPIRGKILEVLCDDIEGAPMCASRCQINWIISEPTRR
jgi:hypothetical protein